MAITEIQARSILNKSGIPGASWVINPYVGCVHGCVYCYARFMRRFTGHTAPWGAFLEAKTNAPELLLACLEKRRTPLEGTVFLSSVTDPYLPAEKKYRLTQRILEILLRFRADVSILTKSDLVLRDIDILSRFERCSVGLSLMTTDDGAGKALEPNAAPPSRRLEVLETLKRNGVRTHVFVSPFIPGVTDLNAVFEAVSGYADEIGVEAINTRAGTMKDLETAMRRGLPEKSETFGKLSADDSFWEGVREETYALAEKAGIGVMGFYRHGESTRR